jgi:malonyl-CoA decarboxylase
MSARAGSQGSRAHSIDGDFMAQVIDLSLFDRAMSRVRRVFARPAARGDRSEQAYEALIAAATGIKGGEHAARGRAALLARTYAELDDDGRGAILMLLVERFGRDAEAVEAGLAAALEASGAARDAALAALGRTLEPARATLFRRFAAMPEGLGFLIGLRDDVRRLGTARPALGVLDEELRHLLALWFDPAMLELVRVDWSSPAAFLEKLMAYEAVHAMDGWDDLKRRLAPDRRIYALRHPMLAGEPLIFVEVALVEGMPGGISQLIGPSLAVAEADEADTAVFYSISNCQTGLAGVPLGNSLIKQVVERLSNELPGLGTFVTLSPVPGFRRWLKRAGADEEIAARVRETTGIEPAALDDAIEADDASEDQVARMAAHYLARERSSAGRALDPVAHFHLGNGARLERVLTGADPSPRGQAQSAGVMVNYLYDLDTIEANVDAYGAAGTVTLGGQARRLLKPDARTSDRATA